MESDPVVPLNLTILYEDNHLLAVDKPPGLLSQGDLTGDLDVLTVAKQLIKNRDQKPGNVFLGLVHRLDRPVGGVMVVAKTSKAAGRLSTQFRERTCEKIYHAVVEGVPLESETELHHFLIKDRKTRITQVTSPGPGAKEARLHYRCIASRQDQTLVEVRLITGLSHQIRCQLSAIGHPIIGDRKYRAQTGYKPGTIALYAKKITFIHPVKKTSITIETAPPKEWPFDSESSSQTFI